ncbi:MAG: uroporphyrin-III C-methyltransferase [Thermoleophilia bacterium]|nr:uroporphyrin-III C-methyltransferase [Thermoleophilia bacterium]
MSNPTIRPGTVYLVGSGPGDLGLVTQRALELVRAADVLLVDRLVPSGLVDEARADAELIDVGKVAGQHAMEQDDINARLVEEARAARIVVRLKGGDPYLFGRGGEEAIHCRAANVPFEVVPAVTSAFAACADAGIPVTHRDLARHVTVVTASAGRDGQGDPDYSWLAKSDGTIVLLMGLRRIGHVADALRAHGMPSHRPVAVISRGTSSQQRTVTGTLTTIAQNVADAKLASPAIIVVGEVVELREHLAWFEERPLFGVRVGVTRARAQASATVAQLEALGAEVVEVPSIRIEPLPTAELDAVIAALGTLDTLAFTSVNGVELFFARLRALGKDARAIGSARVAVVGTATADACRRFGIEPDVIPPLGKRTGAGLASELAQLPVFGTKGAVVRAESGDDALVDGLHGIDVDLIVARAYRTVIEAPSPERIAQLLTCDVVTLTSESTVKNVCALLPEGARLPPVVTIGPTTTSAATWAELHVLQEAKDTSIASLIEAVIERAAANPGRGGSLRWGRASADAPKPLRARS